MTPHLADTPVLETERLSLRAPQPGDYDAWKAFYLSDRAEFIGGGPDQTAGIAWRAFCHIIGMWAVRGFGSFIVTRKGEDTPVAMTGPWYPDDWPEFELGWTVWDPALEGTGLAYEAAQEARRYAYGVLGWKQPVSYIHRDNARSIALAKRLGAVLDERAPAPHSSDVVYRHPPSVEVL